MYGQALLFVLVLIVIFSFTCAYDDSESKNPIVVVSSVIGRGVYRISRAIASITGSIVKGVSADIDDSSDNLSGFSQVRHKDESNIDELAALEGMAGEQNTTGSVSMYDPLQMGAITKEELQAHNKNLKERSPYSTTGVAGPDKNMLDDDPYTKGSGVPWVGHPPRRAFNRRIGGPEAGARATTSTSSKSIYNLYNDSKKAPVWVS